MVKERGVNWIRFGAWAGVVSLIVILISIFLPTISLLSVIAGGFVFFAFVKLGTKTEKGNFLKVMGYVGLFFVLLTFCISLVFSFGGINFINAIGGEDFINFVQESQTNPQLAEQLNDPNFFQNNPETAERLVKSFVKILIFLFILVAVYVIFSILLGVAQLKISKKIRYAKVTGILNIVGGATTIILIGVPVLIVARVFEIMMLFEASKVKGKK